MIVDLSFLRFGRLDGRGPSFMNVLKVSFLYLCINLFGCAAYNGVDNRNFAVDTYAPNPNEIRLAQQRAQRYWQKNAHRFSTPARYLAVKVTSILDADVTPDLYSQLVHSETTASFFGQNGIPELNASCIMIYDTVAMQFVSDSGYLSVDLPQRGWIAHWDSYTARYIGWG
jgi:hypothetical protein